MFDHIPDCGVCGFVQDLGRAAGRALLELVYPEVCVLCHATPREAAWCEVGPRVASLTWSDGPHLCRACAQKISPRPVRANLDREQLVAFGGRSPTADLVGALTQWKYHGVRGLAWPLAVVLQAAVAEAIAARGAVDLLVPIALHRRRRRTRGFNQAEVLARLAAFECDRPVAADVLRRVRSTGQQAKLKSASARDRNLAEAFVARSCDGPRSGCRIGLIDDLVTSGATCRAAAGALRAGGWQVGWVAALGVASAADGHQLTR